MVLPEAISAIAAKLLEINAEDLILALVIFLILMWGWDKIRDWMEQKEK